jgi:hypothetical protein
MKTNPLKQGSISSNYSAIGTVTLEMVKRRAFEIARINGRQRGQIEVSDWMQAKNELTGEPDEDPSDYRLWSSANSSSAKTAEESLSEDTDEEGHSTSARLVEQGIEEAEHDTMLKATNHHS